MEKKNFNNTLFAIMMYLWLMVILAFTIVCGVGMKYMVEKNLLVGDADLYLESSREAMEEKIAIQIVSLYQKGGGWDDVNRYADENDICFAIYSVNGRRMGGNLSVVKDAEAVVYEVDEYYRVKLLLDYAKPITNDGSIFYSLIVLFIQHRALPFVGLTLGVILFVVNFRIFAGRFWKKDRSNAEGEMVFPLDVGLVIFGMLYFAISKLLHIPVWNRLDGDKLIWQQGMVIVTLASIYLLCFIRIMMRETWYHHTLLYFLYGVLRRIPTIKLLASLVVGLSIAEFIVMLVLIPVENQWIYILWVAEKIIVLPLIFWVATALKQLENTAQEMAEGNLKCQVDTTGFPRRLRIFGEYLNRISGGISIAVEEKMKSERLKTQLITNVSHDIKTPLTSIINFSDLIHKEETDNPKIEEYAGLIYKQSYRLKKLLEDLLEASKASTGNLEVHLTPCDVKILLGQCLGEYELKLKEKDLEFIVKQAEEPLWIMADPKFLWRIFDNLMNNICKYAQGNTRVYLSTEKVENNLQITFKNISNYPLDMDADELMERFVRGDLSRHSEGHGLGLSVVRSLMDLQNGQIRLIIDGDLFKAVLSFPLTEAPEEYQP